MLEHLKDYTIILASKSPRRRKLIEELGLKVETTAVNISEDFPARYDPERVAVYLARKKADAYCELSEKELLVTADTIVCLEDQMLGKPSDKKDAFNILNKLSGEVHKVITGVCIRSLNKEVLFNVSTKVHFGRLTPEEINYYIEHYKPYDKAGSYGIQEWIGYIGIDHIEGSFYNVMGLPVHRLYQELKSFYD